MKETTPEEIFKETSPYITLSELYNEFMNKFPRKYVSWRIYGSFSTSKSSNKKSKAYICQTWDKTTLRLDYLKEGKKSKLQTQKHKH